MMIVELSVLIVCVQFFGLNSDSASVPTILVVKKWFTKFRYGSISTSDTECSLRSIKLPRIEIIEKSHNRQSWKP